MSDISRIKINGEIFNINTLTVSPEEPTGAARTTLWIKPKMSTSGYFPTNYWDSTSHYFKFDSTTNTIVETSSYESNADMLGLERATEDGPGGSSVDDYTYYAVKSETTYKIKFQLSGNTLYADSTYGLIYFDNNGTYLSKQSFIVTENISSGKLEQTITTPLNAARAYFFINNNGTSSNQPYCNTYLYTDGYDYNDQGIYYLDNGNYSKIY